MTNIMQSEPVKLVAPLIAIAETTFGARKAYPGLQAIFDISDEMLEATADDIATLRHAGWSQDDDKDFLMDAFRREGEGDPQSKAGKFLNEMGNLISDNVSEVCWRVSISAEKAESWLAIYRPSLTMDNQAPEPDAS
jgi:hypothetical protein